LFHFVMPVLGRSNKDIVELIAGRRYAWTGRLARARFEDNKKPGRCRPGRLLDAS
jgi:hypothetical protein